MRLWNRRARTPSPALLVPVALALVLGACGGSRGGGAGGDVGDAGPGDAAARDAGDADDGGSSDAGTADDGGSSDAGTADDGGTDDDGGEPFAHLLLPQIPDNGGPRLASPKLVTITFPGYALADQVEAFGDWVVGSAWLTEVGADYGIGKGTHAKKARLAFTPPATWTDADLQKFLAQQITAGALPQPGATPSYIYVVYVPPNVTVTNGAGTGSCMDFDGYHAEAQQGTLDFPYAVVGTCDAADPAVPLLENVEVTAAHELIESATDPMDTPGWSIVADASPWAAVPGEVADLCLGAAPYAEGGFFAPRSWSNAAAAAGGDPCVPAAGGVFFDVSPASDAVHDLAAGSTLTLSVVGWANGATPDWSLDVMSGEGDFTLGAQLGSTAMGPGRRTTVTLSVPAGTKSGSYGSVLVTSSTDGGRAFTLWPLEVYVP